MSLAMTQELMYLPIKPNADIHIVDSHAHELPGWVYWLTFLNSMNYWGPFALLFYWYFLKACTRIGIVMLSWIGTVNYWTVIQVSSGKLKLLGLHPWWEMRNHLIFFFVSGMIVGGLANISNTQKSIRCICYISYSFWLMK